MPDTRSWTHDLCWLAACSGLAIALAVSDLRAASGDEPVLPEDASAAREGVLVMRNGTVMAGTISLSEDLYTVRGQYGNLQVPAGLVKMRCASLQDAYSRLHDLTVKHQSANSHLMLAKWCVTNQLDKEAAQELNAALELEPDREDLQRMLRNVTETLSTGRKRPPSEKPDLDEPARALNAVEFMTRKEAAPAEETAAIGGLSVPQALHYIRRIQPLLVKSCATAGCHTRESKTGFQLYHVVPGKDSNRHASEFNLANVLQQVDLKNPSASKLLTIPRGKHGRNSRPVFAGPRGQEQLAELEQWIDAMARDGNRRNKPAIDGERQKSNVQQASSSGRISTAARDPFGVKSQAPPVTLPGGRQESKLSDSGGDPFDPASFNRQASGKRAER